MNQTTKFIFCILLAGVIAMASCKKSSSGTPSSEVPGTWQLTKEYVDNNNNGVMDANEMEPDSVLAIIKLVYVLSADGTYNISLNGYPTSKGTWSLVNNNTYLQLTDTSGSHVNNIYNLVESIGSTSLEIKDTVNAARGGTSWLYFTKQ